MYVHCRERRSDEAVMLETLRSGLIKALVLDNTFVDYQDAINCDLYAGKCGTQGPQGVGCGGYP